ncbi:MAG: ABC transporter ATP-binding protein [Bacteroidales bacterium]|nr:ABC transporter ATP-binding protein [Bacteroidales bacterium]
MNNEDIIIRLEHVSKSFGDKKVLDDINLYVKKGEFITFLGPSGCGKTTLLRLIAGFLAADSGVITMDGKDLNGVPPHKRELNTVFQRYALFPHLDVYDNIAFGLKLKKVPEDEIDRKVSKVLKLVSMNGYEDRDVNSLSGGQQQRIAIARAIVNQPKVLLLDEPLAALDLKMRKDMQIELKEMHRQLGITFIYVTHDQEEALTLSDTIVVFNEGRIQQIGTPTDIYNEPQNEFVADFIGESNILNGTMLEDRRVSFIAHDFDCVDEGFGENVPVDVVVRPEDIYIMNNTEAAQFTGKVKSCIFKGVHYEMFVDTDEGYEIMIQDYNAFEPGSVVGMLIKPQDIQVMKKTCLLNSFEGTMTSDESVSMLGGEYDCPKTEGISKGDRVRIDVAFDRIDLLDNDEDAPVTGNVAFILYKGNHYHLTVITDSGEHVLVDTNDVWDKNDLVGVKILPEDMHITKIGS